MTLKNIEKAVFLVVALIFVLIMSACVTIEERFELASACQLEEGADCQELWDDWNRGVEAQARRDAENVSPCGHGYVLYCDEWCMRTRTRGELWGGGVCVKSSSIRWY